jgi:large subunit ribosomal protein L6
VAVKDVKTEVEFPKGVTWKLERATVAVKGPNGELKRSFSHPVIRLVSEGGKLFITAKAARKRDRALAGTWGAHLANMGEGVHEGHEYHMKIVYSHFPIKTTVEAAEFVIENFLGEQHPRRAKIIGTTKVQVQGDKVTITGPDLEAVSGTAANIEQGTRIRGFDPRVFQDGIYITSKGE